MKSFKKNNFLALTILSIVFLISIFLSASAESNINIINLRTYSISRNTAVITFDTNSSLDCTINYKSSATSSEDNIKAQLAQQGNANNNNQFVYITKLYGLVSGQKYAYYVKCIDQGGIVNQSDVLNFTTEADKQYIIVGDIKATTTPDGSVIITWNSNIETSYNGVMYNDVDLNKGRGAIDSSNSYKKNHSVAISGMNLNQIYKYRVYSYLNSDKNEGAISDYIIFNSKNSQSDESATSEILEKDISPSEAAINNRKMYVSLKGRIILKTEDKGKAFYVDPLSQLIHYLGRPDDAFTLMRSQGIGIENKDLYKIAIGIIPIGADSDKDGLPDNLEIALKLNPTKQDTDEDGFKDKEELTGGYNPWGTGKQSIDSFFSNNHKGKIFLQVQGKGEAWYINPADGKRYFLGRPADAFNAMRTLGLGISNANFKRLSASLIDPKDLFKTKKIVNCLRSTFISSSSLMYAVGAKGGTICSPDKEMWLDIPSGALASSTEIKVSVMGNQDYDSTSGTLETFIGLSYDVSPVTADRLDFLKPCVLNMIIKDAPATDELLVIKSKELGSDSYEIMPEAFYFDEERVIKSIVYFITKTDSFDPLKPGTLSNIESTSNSECLTKPIYQQSPEQTVLSFAEALECDNVEKALLLFDEQSRTHYREILNNGSSSKRVELGKSIKNGAQPLNDKYQGLAVVQIEISSKTESGINESYSIMLAHLSDDKWYVISM